MFGSQGNQRGDFNKRSKDRRNSNRRVTRNSTKQEFDARNAEMVFNAPTSGNSEQSWDSNSKTERYAGKTTSTATELCPSNGRNRQQQKIPKLEYHQQDTDRDTTSIPTNSFGSVTTEADEIDDILKFVSSTTEEEANSQLVKPIKQFSVQSDIIDAKLQSICDEAGQAFPDLAAEFTAGDFLVEELLGEPLSNLEYNQPEGQPMPRPEHQMSSPRQSIGSQSKLSSVPSEPSIGHSDSTQFSQQTECGRSNPSKSPQFKKEFPGDANQFAEYPKAEIVAQNSDQQRRKRRSPKSSNSLCAKNRVIEGNYRTGEASSFCSETANQSLENPSLNNSFFIATPPHSSSTTTFTVTGNGSPLHAPASFHINNNPAPVNSVQIISPSNSYFLSSQSTFGSGSSSSGYEDNLGEITLKSNLSQQQQQIEYTLIPVDRSNN